jgi:ABC-type multidrug transport system ATPase subunit
MAKLGELIDLGDALGPPIGTYSVGMNGRLDLAAALVHDPVSRCT